MPDFSGIFFNNNIGFMIDILGEFPAMKIGELREFKKSIDGSFFRIYRRVWRGDRGLL